MPDEKITLKQANTLIQQEFGVHVLLETLRSWVKKWWEIDPDIATQPGGKHGQVFVNPHKLREKMSETKEKNT
jgi:hypothetical protein